MKIVADRITLDELKTMSLKMFGNLVKAVIDVEKGIMAVDAELHADEEALLLKEGSKQPQRMAKINNKMYFLFAVGTFRELWKEADTFNRLHGSYKNDYFGEIRNYHLRETDINAPCRLKPASKQQMEKWAELNTGRKFERWDKPYLLWLDYQDKKHLLVVVDQEQFFYPENSLEHQFQ